MSSLHVRNFAREQMPKLSTPFFETINTDMVVPTDSIWMTLSFNTFTSSKQSFCDDFMEMGIISLIYFGTAGMGDQLLLSQAESDSQIFYRQSDPSGLLTLSSINAPEEASNSDGRPLYVVSVGVNYSFYQSLQTLRS